MCFWCTVLYCIQYNVQQCCQPRTVGEVRESFSVLHVFLEELVAAGQVMATKAFQQTGLHSIKIEDE